MLSIIIAVFAIIYAALYFQNKRSEDPKEPPIASASIPIPSIGHLIGMLRYQGDYLPMLSKRFPDWDIFTLRIFGSSVYVVTSPELGQSLLCNTKSLSFNQLTIAFTERAIGASQFVKDTISNNAGNNAYMDGIHEATHSSLVLGPELTQTNSSMLDVLAQHLNDISSRGEPLKLYEWIKYTHGLAFGEAFYGPDNPISANPSFIDGVWDYEEAVPLLLLNFFPSITARKAHLARLAFEPAFERYYDQGMDKNANAFIQGRAEAGRIAGMSNRDLARFEIVMAFTALTNAIPNTFSLLLYILQDPELTEEIRSEVRGVMKKEKKDGREYASIDVTAINTCKLLVSCYNENIRLCVHATPVRFVTSTFTPRETPSFHLRKSGIVQITGGPLHSSPSVWNSPETFNPRRFLPKNLTKEQKKHVLSFGGGKHLCPGRNLAFTEITAFVAIVVLGFEIVGGDRKGVRHPGFKRQQLGENSKKPARDVRVEMRRREEFKDVVWRFEV